MDLRSNPLRLELQALLASLPVQRPPALRRSRLAAAVFSSDLPRCASPETVRLFLQRAAASGWEAWEEGGWVHLRKEEDRLALECLRGAAEGEGASILSVLQRHPDMRFSPEEGCLLVKAREEGGPRWEAACRAVHLSLALRLREEHQSQRRIQTDADSAHRARGISDHA